MYIGCVCGQCVCGGVSCVYIGCVCGQCVCGGGCHVCI